jgi:hypothetical protein
LFFRLNAAPQPPFVCIPPSEFTSRAPRNGMRRHSAGEDHDVRAPDVSLGERAAGDHAATPSGGFESRPVRSVADHPDRCRDRRRNRRPQLSGAVPEGIRARDCVHHPRSRRLANRAADPTAGGFPKRFEVTEPRRQRRHCDDRGVGAGHGSVGCACQGRQNAARGVSRRNARRGAGLQQQRPVARRRGNACRRSERARRRRGLQGPQAAARARETCGRFGRNRRRPRRGGSGHQAHGRFQSGAQPRRRAAPLPRTGRSGPLLAGGADRLQQPCGLCAARARAQDSDPAWRKLLRAACALSGAGDGGAATT